MSICILVTGFLKADSGASYTVCPIILMMVKVVMFSGDETVSALCAGLGEMLTEGLPAIPLILNEPHGQDETS